MLIALVLLAVLLFIIARLAASISRTRQNHHYGFGPTYSYGFNRCLRRHRHRFAGGLLSVLAIIAVKRLLRRRF